jgi:hypothetical protein
LSAFVANWRLVPAADAARSPVIRFLRLGAFFVAVAGTAWAGSPLEADLVGLWQVDPSTYAPVVREPDRSGKALIITKGGAFMATNIKDWRIVGPPLAMPTNLSAFTLSLSNDHSFVAKNIPDHVFFNWPVTPEASGKWSVTNYELNLSIRKPSPGIYGTPVTWRERGALRQAVVHAIMNKSWPSDGLNIEICLTNVHGATAGQTKQATAIGEPNAAANQSQPVASGTNLTSAAAGSGR